MSVGTLVKSIQNIMRQDVGVDGDAQRISQLCWMFFLKIIDDQDQELELLDEGYRSPIPASLRWRHWAADPEGITGEELLDFVNGDLFPHLKELPIRSGPRASVVRDVFEDAYNYLKSGQLLRQVINKINGVDFNNLTDRRHFGDIYEQVLNDLQSAGNAGEYYTPRARDLVHGADDRPETGRDPARSGVRHRRLPHLRRPSHARAVCEADRGRCDNAGLAARGREEAASPYARRHQHALCTASRTRPSCVTTTRWRGPTPPGAATSASTSCSPIRRSAARRRTASSRTFRRTSGRVRRRICSWP